MNVGDLCTTALDLRDALEDITSLAVEVKANNTPEFMEYLRERIAAVTLVWEESFETLPKVET